MERRHPVIFVDGPERGNVHEVESQRTYVVAIPLSVQEMTEMPYAPDFKTLTYTTYRIAMFGRMVRVASMRPEGPRGPDLFDVLASGAAKDAVVLE